MRHHPGSDEHCAGRGRQVSAQHATREAVHVPFIVVALAISILGGFLLGISLPLSAAIGLPLRGWIPHAQVHGHLQAVGFVGLFIVGVAYRLVPNFVGKPTVRFPRLVPVSLWLIAVGVLLRAGGQPAAARDGLWVLMAAGAWLEVAGAACFAVNVVATLRPLRADPAVPFFLAGTAWFLVQAVLGGWWVTGAAAARVASIPPSQDELLVLQQLFGFHLLFILGVGVRSFPVFFAMPRLTVRSVMPPFVLAQAGLLAVTVATMGAGSGRPWGALHNLGTVALAAGLVWVAGLTGWWRPPTRIRAASRPFALTLQLAMMWLTLASALMARGALRALVAGTLPPWAEMDAARHIVAVGVVLTTMVGMAQLVLPEFASERFTGRQGAWRGIALGLLLAVATAMRAGSRLLADALPSAVVQWTMAASGMIALVVVIIFAVLFARGVRHHRDLRERFEALAARGELWTLTPRDGGPPSRGGDAG